jgi:hypothetical protein
MASDKGGRGNGQLEKKAKFYGFGGVVCSICGTFFRCELDPWTDEILRPSCLEQRNGEYGTRRE